MKEIAVVTVGRSDFGIYLPLLERLADESQVSLRIIAGGMHLSPEFGLTVNMIEEAGFAVSDRVEMLLSSDTPEGIAKSMGLGMQGFAQIYGVRRPDWLIVLGDRFEMFSAVAAAVPFRIPVAHLHGGELTFGAMDEAFRHSITKMSHLHFASTSDYAKRIVQLGEAPWRVIHAGALSLDGVENIEPLAPEELEKRFGIDLSVAPLLATFHPVSLQVEQTEEQVEQFLAALSEVGWPVVFTLPNADTAGRLTRQKIEMALTHGRVKGWMVENFGRQPYFSMLRHARAMVGNSSSGILEAASFHLPVVNIGDRQAGRTHAENVVDVPPQKEAIAAAIRRVGSDEFRAMCRKVQNPYVAPEGRKSSDIIVEKILSTEVDEQLLVKRFHDLKN